MGCFKIKSITVELFLSSCMARLFSEWLSSPLMAGSVNIMDLLSLMLNAAGDPNLMHNTNLLPSLNKMPHNHPIKYRRRRRWLTGRNGKRELISLNARPLVGRSSRMCACTSNHQLTEKNKLHNMVRPSSCSHHPSVCVDLPVRAGPNKDPWGCVEVLAGM